MADVALLEEVKTADELSEISEQIDDYVPDPKGTWKLKKQPVYNVLKRVGDILCSLIAITVLFIPLLVVAIIIMVDDFGSPIYSHMRIGKNGKPFKMYKFRSMYKDADARRNALMTSNESDGVTFKMENDPRITKIGRFIRKTSIDELPQLINILKGDMSVIGPRPFIPSEQEKLPFDRLLVNPGLSCYWQVGGKNKLTRKQADELDKKYVEHHNVLVDIKIIFLTFKTVLKSDNT